MNITISKANQVKVQGHRTNGNCKPVYCINTGEVFASVTDAAEKHSVAIGNLSAALTGKSKTCHGKRYCFIVDVTHHLDEIAEHTRIREVKVQAYDAEKAAEEAKRKANEDYERHKAKCVKLREELEKETYLMTMAKQKMCALQ